VLRTGIANPLTSQGLDTETRIGFTHSSVGLSQGRAVNRSREPAAREAARPAGVGEAGEGAAAAHLRARGWRLIARNARTRWGELDIVALDGQTLVFVEVKARRGAGPGSAELALESIGPRKRIQVRRLARAWLAGPANPGGYREIRFDAIGVSVGPSLRANAIRHLQAAF
jgi:putative endonuclease